MQRACLAALLIAGCSSSEPHGRVVVAITIDWEGVDLSPEGLDALDALRKDLGDVPITHFVSAAYFTKDSPEPSLVASIQQVVHPSDELAIHLHAWRSLAKAAGVEPKLSPSFLSGTDKLIEFEDGDIGFDTDLDAYRVWELRRFLGTSRQLLEQTHLPVSHSFRAGGYLGTPKMLDAIRHEGYTVDSSALDHRGVGEPDDAVLSKRLDEIWPRETQTTQPFFTLRGGDVLEMPIAAVADYASATEIAGVLEAAYTALHADPSRDRFVVLAFHLETAVEFGGRLREAVRAVRGRHQLADTPMFATIENAADLAQRLAPISR